MVDDREPRRRRVQRATQLLDSGPEPAFDRLTRLAAELVGAPLAIISLVDERRQFFKAAIGLSGPWASGREPPLTHALCETVVRDRAPVVIADTRTEPGLRDDLDTRDHRIAAYAGVPLFYDDEAIGALCA